MEKILFVFIVLISQSGYSQVSFFHGAHAAYEMIDESGCTAIGAGIGYVPRLNIEIDENHSFSISSNISIMLGGDAGAFSFPVLFGFNYGNCSTPDSEYDKDFGLFFNLGMGNLLYANETEGYTDGIAVNGGIRIKGFDGGIYYMQGLTSSDLTFMLIYFGYTWSI